MVCNTLPSIIAVIGMFWLPESPKYLLGQGRFSESVDVLRKVYAMNSGQPKSTYPCDIVTLNDVGSDLSKVKSVWGFVKLVWTQTTLLFTKTRVLQTLNMCTIAFIINLISQGTFMYFPTIINNIITQTNSRQTVCETFKPTNDSKPFQTLEEMCADPDSMNIKQYEYLAYMGCFFMACYLFISIVINYTGKKTLLSKFFDCVFSNALTFFYFVVIWFAVGTVSSLLLHWLHNMILVLVCLTLTIVIANCIGILSTVALEFYPTNINAMGVSFVMMVGRLGAVIGTNIVGPLLFAYCETLFFAFSAAISFIFILAYCLPRGSSK